MLSIHSVAAQALPSVYPLLGCVDMPSQMPHAHKCAVGGSAFGACVAGGGGAVCRSVNTPFVLRTAFPNKAYEDKGQTLEQAGLVPNARMMVRAK